MGETRYWLRPIGWVESPLIERDEAPRQGDEGAPGAWLVLDPAMQDAMGDLEAGGEVIGVTWLDRASLQVQLVPPRGDEGRPGQGVFATRLAGAANQVGPHKVPIAGHDGDRV